MMNDQPTRTPILSINPAKIDLRDEVQYMRELVAQLMAEIKALHLAAGVETGIVQPHVIHIEPPPWTPPTPAPMWMNDVRTRTASIGASNNITVAWLDPTGNISGTAKVN